MKNERVKVIGKRNKICKDILSSEIKKWKEKEKEKIYMREV